MDELTRPDLLAALLTVISIVASLFVLEEIRVLRTLRTQLAAYRAGLSRDDAELPALPHSVEELWPLADSPMKLITTNPLAYLWAFLIAAAAALGIAFSLSLPLLNNSRYEWGFAGAFVAVAGALFLAWYDQLLRTHRSLGAVSAAIDQAFDAATSTAARRSRLERDAQALNLNPVYHWVEGTIHETEPRSAIVVTAEGSVTEVPSRLYVPSKRRQAAGERVLVLVREPDTVVASFTSGELKKLHPAAKFSDLEVGLLNTLNKSYLDGKRYVTRKALRKIVSDVVELTH